MTQQEADRIVPAILREIERIYGVQVLYAAEAGSRAWGYAAPDSDFDLRFIYRRPATDYLRLDLPRDTIEQPVDETWDIAGWDLSKALRLLYRSDPALYEWLGSPVRYVDRGFSERIRPLLEERFSPRPVVRHYLGMSRRNERLYLNGKKIAPKKLLYVLRPLLCSSWICREGTAPPVDFRRLCAELMPAEAYDAAERLLELKRERREPEEIDRIPELAAFIAERTVEIDGVFDGLPRQEDRSWESLDRFFLREIRRRW
ncbi:MAG: nucleotidyltransferase domain-containing protein [Oscillospiraceae bacterium]|nr:nucleotidyltransferase domain-containing protein [Oscillospiraceae bacterium]